MQSSRFFLAAKPLLLPSWAKPRTSVLGTFSEWCGDFFLRSAGFLLRVGNAVMPSNWPREEIYKLPRLVPLHGVRPQVADNCFVASSAVVIGNVCVGRKCYVGYNAVLRGDGGAIVLGESSNVQEKAVLLGPVTVGKWTTVEPMAVIDGAHLASGSFVGAGAIVMRGAVMESGSLLCAAAVLQAGATIPSGEVWAGNPAVKIGHLTEDEQAQLIKAAKHLVLLGIEHHDSAERTWEELENMRISREVLAEATQDSDDIRVRAFYVREGPRMNQRKSPRLSNFEAIEGRNAPTGRWEAPFPVQ